LLVTTFLIKKTTALFSSELFKFSKTDTLSSITNHDCSLKPGISGGARLLKAPAFEELLVATTGFLGLNEPPIAEPKLSGNEKSAATFGRGILRMILPEVMRRPKPSWWANA